MYKAVAPVYTQFLDRSISATQSVSRNSEGHIESVQPIKCMLFILIFNNTEYINTSECVRFHLRCKCVISRIGKVWLRRNGNYSYDVIEIFRGDYSKAKLYWLHVSGSLLAQHNYTKIIQTDRAFISSTNQSLL